MKPETMQEAKEVMMPEVEVIIAGRLDIGKDGEHQVKSTLETDEAIKDYTEKTRRHLVRAEQTNCAVCIDGRGCRCLASDVSDAGMPEYKKPPIRTKMEGGTVNAMTDAALLAGWSGFKPEDYESFDVARASVKAFLEKEGFEDAAHTSDVSLASDQTTECGAWMKKNPAMQEGAEIRSQSAETKSASALDMATGAYSGLSGSQLLSEDANQDNEYTKLARRSYVAITGNQRELVGRGIFGKTDPIKLRNDMRASNPEQLEVLYSDPEHPTHNHKEPMLVIIDTDDPDLTIDRDAMYEEDGFAPFVDNRNKRRQLANLMGATEEEKFRLLMAGDIATVDVGHQLFAPGMPVIVIK